MDAGQGPPGAGPLAPRTAHSESSLGQGHRASVRAARMTHGGMATMGQNQTATRHDRCLIYPRQAQLSQARWNHVRNQAVSVLLGETPAREALQQGAVTEPPKG